jgi:hypothetical protein
MPLPEIKPQETKDDFVARCMRDKTMVTEYADIRQRAAICYSQSKK